jgi:octaprenyl-diphosphate synthase
MNSPIAPPTVKAVLTPIDADMQALNAVIQNSLHSEVPLVNRIGDYIIAAGGKRLRPALVLLIARALGLPESDMPKAHTLAAVVEFIHTATLLHDDVVDESDLRRGRSTANAKFGNPASVLVGDFLYSRAFQMMVSIGNLRVMDILADATNTIAEGEVLQLLNCNDPKVTETGYFKVIEYKTAKLFEAAARLAAVLAGKDQATERLLGQYGLQLGTAFQLIDDVLDYDGQSAALGKNVGDDLKEGKPTLPLIHALHTADASGQALIRSAIEQGGTTDVEPVLKVISQCGSLRYTRQCAQHQAAQAAHTIENLPSSIYKQALLELCKVAIERNS